MKTIFDWLTMPMFRERTGMFLGRRDPEALDIWIDGYQLACEDAGEHERLRTPGGVPIHLLRDYIAMKENDTSSNGIPHILREAVGEEDDSLMLDRFFSHVDALMRLSIRSVWHAKITPEMRPNFVTAPENMPTGFRKVSLTEDLCWMIVETPSGEYYWDCIGDVTGRWPFGRWKIGPEAVADAFMERTYKAALVWEPTDGSAYPAFKAFHNLG